MPSAKGGGESTAWIQGGCQPPQLLAWLLDEQIDTKQTNRDAKNTGRMPAANADLVMLHTGIADGRRMDLKTETN